MAYNLGTAQGNIRIFYDSRGILRARDDLGRFISLSRVAGEESDRMSHKLNLAFKLPIKALLKMTKYITITSVALTSMATAGNAAVAAVAALAPVAGAGLATLPGLAVAAAAAFGVLKLA